MPCNGIFNSERSPELRIKILKINFFISLQNIAFVASYESGDWVYLVIIFDESVLKKNRAVSD